MLSLLAAGVPASSAQESWAARCERRLGRARAELAAIAPWAARAEIETEALTAPMRGWIVRYDTDDGRAYAMIEDYPGATRGRWDIAPRGECFDESEPPPQLSIFRNYDGRQAQIRVDGAPHATRVAIARTLRAALNECASY